MKVLAAAVLCAVATVVVPFSGHAQERTPKVAILNIQAAIAQCNDGKQAAKELQDRFGPKRAELEKQQREIDDLQKQLAAQEKTLSEDARSRLLRSIDDKTRVLNRNNEDASAEMQQAEQDVINEIGRKMMTNVNDYAQKNGFTLVLDVSSPQTPVLYADTALDVTEKIVELYNASASKPSGSTSPGQQPKPAAK